MKPLVTTEEHRKKGVREGKREKWKDRKSFDYLFLDKVKKQGSAK